MIRAALLALFVPIVLLIGWLCDRPLLLAVVIPLAAFEACVVASAVLDWRESRLVVVGWRQAWAVAHATVFVRAFRRTRHALLGARIAWGRRQLRRRLELAEATEGYVVLDPTAPFVGRVIDVEPQEATDEQRRAS